VLCAVKEREAVGYACEAANASFELLASAHDRERRCNIFDVSQFDVNVEQRVNAVGEWVTSAWQRSK